VKRKFIINPRSGYGISETKFKEIKDYFLSKTGEFDYIKTTQAMDATKFAKEAIKAGYTQIIAVGGDGTINEVLNGFFENGTLLNPDVSLGISQNGTGSDFYKSIIHQDKKIDWKDVILANKTKQIDIGKFNFLNQLNQVHYFINIGGAGVSSDVVLIKDRLPLWIPKSLNYIAPTVMALKSSKDINATISYCYPESDGRLTTKEMSVNLLELLTCNGVYAGGGMKFAPNATLDNGLFEICLVKRISVLKALPHLPKLYGGGFDHLEFIEYFKASKISVSSKDKMGIELDGEYIGCGSFQMELIPKCISICYPS